MKNIYFRKRNVSILLAILAAIALFISSMDVQSSNLRLIDISTQPQSGINYERIPHAATAAWLEKKRTTALFLEDILPQTPQAPYGQPGIAVFDYDGDSDLDIYVTNGAGKADSLFSNQLSETGALSFVDMAEVANTELEMSENAGVCVGDIDNDNDMDILVISPGERNHLLENNGQGMFEDISESSGLGLDLHGSVACAMGDINNDGLIDVAIANTYIDWSNRLVGTAAEYDQFKEANQLFVNLGGNRFSDISNTSDFSVNKSHSWALAMIDYDQDGDTDIIVADDHGVWPPAKYGGEDKGVIRVYQNDGNGNFIDFTEQAGTNYFGAWMGLSFGDVNGDKYIDMFATNAGDYLAVATGPLLGIDLKVGDFSSSLFLGASDGKFERQGNGGMGTSVFGWGAAMRDYDNDGDTDIIYYGGFDMGALVDATNPGVFLRNNGYGDFSYDESLLSQSVNHTRRTTKSLIMADLNQDGFLDAISVASQKWPEKQPLVPLLDFELGGRFDNTAMQWVLLAPVDSLDLSLGFVSSGMESIGGDLVIEISNASNDNNWVRINPIGSVGLVETATVNRDAIGTTLRFTSLDGVPTTVPVMNGGGFSGSDLLGVVFGLGTESKGTVEILWPGGVKNKHYDMLSGESYDLYEIPCSYDDSTILLIEYFRCIKKSSLALLHKNLINKKIFFKYVSSAMRARFEYVLSQKPL